MKTKTPQKIRIVESIVSIGSGFILGVLAGLILGTAVGIGIAMILGII